MARKKTLSKDFIDKWSHLLDEVEVNDVPIEYIDRLEMYFNNGRPPAFIDVPNLLQDQKPWRLEKIINDELEAIDDILEHVDFHLNIEKVAESVDDATKEVLKNL